MLLINVCAKRSVLTLCYGFGSLSYMQYTVYTDGPTFNLSRADPSFHNSAGYVMIGLLSASMGLQGVVGESLGSGVRFSRLYHQLAGAPTNHLSYHSLRRLSFSHLSIVSSRLSNGHGDYLRDAMIASWLSFYSPSVEL